MRLGRQPDMFFRRGLCARLAAAVLVLGSAGALAQTNGVLREVYYNIPGTAVADLTNAPNFPNDPDEVTVESAFEAPSNIADNYGQRMRALLLPPVTGSYVFWIAADDNSALFLSTDEQPAHRRQIAYETSWTNPRQYTLYASQKSAPISLTNGLRYYIEALQKEGGGGDNLAVTWQKPGDAAPADGAAPIPGNLSDTLRPGAAGHLGSTHQRDRGRRRQRDLYGQAGAKIRGDLPVAAQRRGYCRRYQFLSGPQSGGNE